VLDEQLVQRVLELIRNAHIAVAVSSVAIDFGLAFFGGLWKPSQVLAEAEDVSVDSETRPLEAEQCDARCGLGSDAGISQHLIDGVVGTEQMEVVERDYIMARLLDLCILLTFGLVLSSCWVFRFGKQLSFTCLVLFVRHL